MLEIYTGVARVVSDYKERYGNDKAVQAIINNYCITNCLKCIYNYLSNAGQITKIERISEERKNYFREITKGRFTDSAKRFNAIKAIYVFEIITSE